ncbi:DDE-type integrase/transposase/recombinase [Euryhalocaulis caribicus]
MQSFTQWRWHLNEIFLKIRRATYYIWLAVDHEGLAPEAYVS